MPPDGYPILNVSTSSDILFIYSNYRLNAFGFLPGKEVSEDPGSDLNAGLLDQEAVLRWTRKYIRHFGGDPDNVTIWGQSAGGASTLAHTMARTKRATGCQRPSLYKQALILSPFWQRPYLNSMPEAQARYDRLAEQVGCSGPDSLQCLKKVNFERIRTASLNVTTPTEQVHDTFAWGPIIDEEYLPFPLSTAGQQIASNTPRIFSLYNTHEGENFIPSGLQKENDTGTPPFNSSVASFDSWLAAFLPAFTPADLEQAKNLYPPSGAYNELESYNDSYSRAGLVYRDVVLACPAYWAAAAAPKGSWLSEYMLPPAKHSSEFVWYKNVGPIQQTDPVHYKGYVGMLASFFLTGDPNALKLTGEDVPSVPNLSSGKRFIVDKDGFTTASMDSHGARCDFWKSLATKIPL
ncbi:carboxylesterase [Paramyrothecium foliicola]|nr:carboxylesterase [Paramyrothecium foliicola]